MTPTVVPTALALRGGGTSGAENPTRMSGTEGRETTDLVQDNAPGATSRDVLVSTGYTGKWSVQRMMYESCVVKLGMPSKYSREMQYRAE